MSGPKRYAVQVFDQHLKQLFALQAEIRMWWDALSKSTVEDENGHVYFSAAGWIGSQQDFFDELTSLVVSPGRDELSQVEFDNFYNRIFTEIDRLVEFRSALLQQHRLFEDTLQNFDRWQEAIQTARSLTIRFLEQKKALHKYLLTQIKEPRKLQKISDTLEKLIFEPEVPVFSANEDVDYPAILSAIKNEYTTALRKMNSLAENGSGKRPENIGKKAVGLVEPDELRRIEYHRIRNETDALLAGLEDQNLAARFLRRLQKLPEGDHDNYTLKELHAEVLEALAVQKLRHRAMYLVMRLENMEAESQVAAAFENIYTEAKALVDQKRIKPDALERMAKKVNAFEKKNQQIIQERLAAAEEQQYIRARLVAELRALNYDVIDHMEVVDLEQPDDLLLEVPGQPNFVNLRFDPKGKLVYNFLIPEHREKLSQEKINERLAEMQQSCNDFKQTLQKLQAQGLMIDREQALPVGEKALIRLPEKYDDILKKQQNRHHNIRLRRKYIGD